MTAASIDLRPYQQEVIGKLRAAVAAGHRRILLVAPTGAGKTVIASALIAGASSREKRALVFAHRRELVTQTSKKVYAAGLDHGIIQAGFPARPDAPIQVASIQTLHARAVRGSMETPPADLVVVDEAHRARAESYRQILDRYRDSVVIGLTATPVRGDGRGLGNIFDAMVECPSVAELIAMGFLVPTRVYAPSEPDLKGVRTRAGDYIEGELAERMDRSDLIGDITAHWFRLAENRKTVVFATNVKHSRHIAEEFLAAGVPAAHIDGKTPTEERDCILARLAAGDIRVVTNCMVLTEGWDCPDVSCCILARPTKQIGLYRQMVGRVLRTAPGKTDALVLDHAGSTVMHGFAEDPITWTLHEDSRAENKAHAARKARHGHNGVVECHECKTLRMPGKACPSCGWMPKGRAEAPNVADGDLDRIEAGGRRQARIWTPEEKDEFLCELTAIASMRRYQPGWAAHKFKEKFGHWPARPCRRPVHPKPETMAWVRSRQIAFAKARKAVPRD